MKLLYEETLDGISVRRCYGLDGIVQIPDRIDGKPVTGLEGYLFSETVRGRGVPPHEYEGEPELCGSQVKELVLPRYAKRIGAYAFYNCSGLRKLSCQSTVDDWGAGVFTGCTGIASLDMCEGGRKVLFQGNPFRAPSDPGCGLQEGGRNAPCQAGVPGIF